MYFHSIIDRQAVCDANVVDLNELDADLASASTTPSYSFITPDLCADGHDSSCADGTSPGGYAGIDYFLSTWVPKITGSPAFADDGLLIVTFDEASGDASDCCNEPQGPTPTSNGRTGNGGGRIGAVLVSKYIKANSTNDTPYNHYSLLRSTEDLFGLTHLGHAAQDGLKPFEDDVFNQPPDGPKPSVTVTGVPKGCSPPSFKAKVQVVARRLEVVRAYVDGRRTATSAKHKFSVKVNTGKLKKGKHRLKLLAKDKLGRMAGKTVEFRVCR
jgi:hypothetical protein